MVVTAGNSVESSGFIKEVNWATGYTNVLPGDLDSSAALLADGWMRGFKTVDEYAM